MVLLAMTAIACIGILSVVLVNLFFPGQDNVMLIAIILGLMAPTIISITTMVKVHDLHLAVNSRLTQLLDQTEKASELAGRAAQRRDDRDR
jgi:hypothetical protein